MFNKNLYKYFFTAALILSAALFTPSQAQPLFFKDAIQVNRNAFYKNVVSTINYTFTLPFIPDNDEKWQSAFYNIGLLQLKSANIDVKIDAAAKVLQTQSDGFKKAFLNLINSNYQNKYAKQIKEIFISTADNKLMAMGANYLLPSATLAEKKAMLNIVQEKFAVDPYNAILHELNNQIQFSIAPLKIPSLKSFFVKDYLLGEMLLFSFQRKNRNYPGLAMLRKADGSFVKNDNGNYFSVGQLARSNSNMPGYISNGNTPQGIFKMTGFDTSTNYFIGPTTNIQLAMPHEYNSFVQDGKLVDTTWSIEQYTNLLPDNFKKYEPMFGTFYAGKAGRTEIIAHGTTIDVNYYKTNSYYPYTPTAGCLCTKEIWNNKTGLLDISDQQKLSQALQNAGGGKGYLIVIEIDDKNIPVTLSDLLQYLK
jgi:hypothetical protein